MTIIPRRGGRKAGLDHFGIEVEDLDKVREKMAKKYPDIEIVKRPGNRPFASYSRARSGRQLFRSLAAGPREPRRGLCQGRMEAGQHHQPLRAARAPCRQDGGASIPTCSIWSRATSQGEPDSYSPHRRPRDADDPAVDDLGLQRRRHRAAGDGSHRLPGAEHRRVQEEPRRGREAEPAAAPEADRIRFRGRRAAEAAAPSARTAASTSPIPTAR